MRIIENVAADRGSRHAVSGGSVSDRAGAEALVAALKKQKKFSRATHNSWALWVEKDGMREPVKDDDGETGAGALILRMLEREGLVNHVVVVSRWYGGVKLGGDRFRHVTAAVRAYLAEIG